MPSLLTTLTSSVLSATSTMESCCSEWGALAATEMHRFSLYCGHRRETAALQRLFSKAREAIGSLFHRSAEERAPFVATQGESSLSSRLLAEQIRELAPSPRLAEPLPARLDPERLRRLSLLQRLPDEQTLSYDTTLLRIVAGSLSSSAKEPFLRLLTHLRSFLAEHGTPELMREGCLEAFGAAFDRQRQWQSRLQEVGLTHDGPRQAQLLGEEAQELAQQVATLQVGETFFHRGQLGKTTPFSPLATSLLKQQLPEAWHEWLVSGSAGIAESLKRYLHEQKSLVLNQEQQQLLHDVAGRIHRHLEAAVGQVQGHLPTSWYEKLASSLKQDLRELATGRSERLPNQEATTAERLWDQLTEQGLAQAIDSALEDLLGSSIEALAEGIDQLASSLQQELPHPLTEVLETMELSLTSSIRFWLEVERGEEGKCTVCLLCPTARGSALHPAALQGDQPGCQFPLVFRNVAIEKLSKQFFVRLLSHHAWPEWDLGVTYSLTDLRQECTLLLGQEPDGKAFLPDQLSIGQGALDSWMAHAYPRQGLPAAQFRKLYRYQLPLELLCRSWPRLLAESSQLRDTATHSTLELLCSHVAKEARALEKLGELSDEELQACHATLWEVRKELAAKVPVQRVDGLDSAFLLPQELSTFLEQLFMESGITSEHFETIKELFVAIVGEEGSSTFDFIVDAFLPHHGSPHALTPSDPRLATGTRSWPAFFQLDQLASYLHQLRTMRLSLLHLYRVLVPLIARFIALVQWLARLSFLTNLLGGLAPQLPQGVLFLLAMLGPSAIEGLMAAPFMETIREAYSLYSSCVSYLKRRIALLILSSLARRLVTPDEIDRFHRTIQALQQRINRHGSLSFELAPPELPLGRVELSLPPMAATAPPLEPVVAPAAQCEPVVASAPPIEEALPCVVACEVTCDKLTETLKLWESKARQLSAKEPFLCELFLCEQLRSLPLPSKPPERGLWEEIENPQEILEQLHLLMLLLHRNRRGGGRNNEGDLTYRTTELLSAQYTFIAIFGRLASRCPEACLPSSYVPNSSFLAYYMALPSLRLIYPKTRERLKQLAVYFGFIPFHAYTKEELDELESRDIFGESGKSAGAISSYYAALLEQPALKRKLVLYGCPSDSLLADQVAFLHSDPTAHQVLSRLDITIEGAEARKREIEELSRKDHPRDFHHGLLPRPTYLLSLANRMAEFMLVKKDSIFDLAPLSSPPKATRGSNWTVQFHRWTGELLAPKIAKLRARSYFNGNDVCRIMPYNFSNISRGAYRDTRIHTVAPQALQLSQLVNPRTGRARTASQVMVDSLPAALFAKVALEPYFYLQPLKVKDREMERIATQYVADKEQLLVSGKNISELLTFEEEALLKIATEGDAAGKLVRLLSFFGHARWRLAHPDFLLLFRLLINQVHPLQLQLQENPQFLSQLAPYFLELLDYCAAEPSLDYAIPTIARIYSELLGHSRSYHPLEADHHREELRRWIRAHLPPTEGGWHFDKVQLRCNGYITLLWTYLEVDPEELPKDRYRQALLDIGQVRYAKYPKRDYGFDSEDQELVPRELFYRWEPRLRHAIIEDPPLRNELLDRLLADVGFDASRIPSTWEGAFPRYQKGLYLIDLLSTGLISNTSASLAEGVDLFPRDERRELVRTIEGQRLIYREIEGQFFRLLSAEEVAQSTLVLKQGEQLWLSTQEGNETPLLLRTQAGQAPSTRYRLARDGAEPASSRYSLQTAEECDGGRFLQRYPLDGIEHQLHLLSWFQPLSTIHLLIESDPTGQPGRAPLRRLLFSNLELTFELQQRDDTWHALAIDESQTGFFIATRQYDRSLLCYGRYLLLENGQGERRVHLLAQGSKQLWLQLFTKKLAHISLTPYLQELLWPMLQEQEELFTYSIDEGNRLQSGEAAAIAYLMLFHYMHNDLEKAYDYWSQLKELSALEPPTQQLLGQLDPLVLPLLFEQTREAGQLLLEIVAWRTEQLLLHELAKPKALSLYDMIWAAATQHKYGAYLAALEAGGSTSLSEYQELFLLKSLERFNEAIFEQKVSPLLPSEVEALLKKIGIRGLAEQLFVLPAIARRRQQLCEERNEGSRWQRAAELVLLESAFGQGDAPQLDIEGWALRQSEGSRALAPSRGVQLQRSSFFSKALAIYKAGKGQLAKKERDLAFERWERASSLATVPVELEELTPENIVRYFLPMYSLLFRSAAGAEQQQAERLGRHLSLLRGEWKEAAAASLLRCLQRLVEQGERSSYLSPEDLNKLIELYHTHKGLLEQLEGWTSARQSNPQLRTKGEEDKKAKKSVDHSIDETKKAIEKLYSHPLLNNKTPKEVLQTYLNWMESTSLLHQGVSLLTSLANQGEGSSLLLAGAHYATHIAKVALTEMTGLGSIYRLQSLINGGLNSWHLVRKLQQQSSVAAEQRQRRAAASQLVSYPMPEQLRQGLLQREQGIDAVMEGLLLAYFELEPLPIVQREEPMAPPPFEGDAAALQEAWNRLQAELAAYYRRPAPPTLRYRLKADRSLAQLQNELHLLRLSVQERLLQERLYIEEYVQHPFATAAAAQERQLLIDDLGHRVSEPKKLFFNAIDQAFIQNRDELLKAHNSSLGPAELLHLKERLYLYHLMASRWQFFFSQLAQPASSQGEELFHIGVELQRRRAWTFDPLLPEQLLKGKLVWESRSGLLLRKLQTWQLDRLLLSKHPHLVAELTMGSGKSSGVIPMSSYVSSYVSRNVSSDGEVPRASLVMNIWPQTIANEAISLSFRHGKKLFGQSAIALKLHRSLSWSRDQLWALLLVLERALYEHEQVNMTKEQLQTLELCFIEQLLDTHGRFSQDEALWKERLELFRRCLWLIRQHGHGHVDESHVQFSSEHELNHPLGGVKKLKESYVATVEQLLLYLVSLPSIQRFLTIKTAKPVPLDEETYEREVLPHLAKAMASTFSIASDDKPLLATYLAGQAEEIPTCVFESRQRSEIALAKGLLTLILKKALAKTIHVDFACSKQKGEEYARPSVGNMNPQERSTIRNPFEALVKSALLVLHDRLKEHQLDKLIEELRLSGEQQAKSCSCPLQATESALFFRTHCPSFDLFSFLPSEKGEVYRQLNASDAVILHYLRHFIAKEISFFSLNLSSNGSNFGSLFASFFSMTGTPYNVGCYPLGTQLLRDPGTDGETIDLLLQMGHRPGAIQLLEQNSPSEALEEIIGFLESNRNLRAIIDRGALFNGLSNEQVARRLLQYIEELRPDLDGIVFYLKGEQMSWKKGAAKPLPCSRSPLPKERCFTYFPQPQTYGADRPQMQGAVALLSVGETTTFPQLAQAAGRMRGLKTQGQSLYFVMTKEVRDRICQAPHLPTIEQILLFTEENGKKQLKPEVYQADKHKLHDIVRTAIRDKTLSPSLPLDEAIALGRTFHHLFVTSVEEDPFFLFGMIDLFASPELLFKTLKQMYRQLLEGQPGLFQPQELDELRLKIDSIGNGSYPEKVHLYRKEGQLSLADDDQDRTMELDQEQEAHREEKKEENKEEELQIELQQELEQQQAPLLHEYRVQTFFPWSEKLQPQNIDSWLQISPVPSLDSSSSAMLSKLSCYIQLLTKSYIPSEGGAPPLFRLRDLLISLPEEGAADLGRLVSSTLLISNNISYLVGPDSSSFVPFGPTQVPLQELLIIWREGELPWLVAIDPQETAYWRRKLAQERAKGQPAEPPKVRLGLYDLGSSILLAQGQGDLSCLMASPLFARAIVQWKFLRGDVHYTPAQSRILLPWLEKNYEPMICFFYKVHRLHGKNLLRGSDLDRISRQIKAKQLVA